MFDEGDEIFHLKMIFFYVTGNRKFSLLFNIFNKFVL